MEQYKGDASVDQFIDNITSLYLENEWYLNRENLRDLSFVPDLGHLDEGEFKQLVIRDIASKQVSSSEDINHLKFHVEPSTHPLSKMGKIMRFLPLDINSYQFGMIHYIKKRDSNVVREFVRYLFENQCPRALQVILIFFNYSFLISLF